MDFANQFGLNPDGLSFIEHFLLHWPLDPLQLFQLSENSLQGTVIKSASDLADVFQLIAICLSQMERTETGFPVTFPQGVADDGTLQSLPGFDFQPRWTSLSGKIRAVALLGDDAFKAHLFNGFKESCSFFDGLTDAIRAIFLDRIFKPFAPAG